MEGQRTTQSFLNRLRNMPLRYRLSISFFFLAFFGTTSLTVLAILSENDLIIREERERMHGYHRAFDYNIQAQGRWAVSVASSMARNPEVAGALANQDRMRLIQLCYPAYVFMKRQYGISQFNFHVLPPRMLIRLQRLYEFGDDLGYRKTISDALSSGKETFGLEEGLTGYGIRGVAPVYHEGTVVGSVEIGFNFGSVFLEEMKNQFGIEASLLLPDQDGSSFKSLESTTGQSFVREEPAYREVFTTGWPVMLIRKEADREFSVWVRAFDNYQGKIVGLAEFRVDRSGTLRVIHHYRWLMIGVGVLGMLFSVAAIYLISDYFTKPIARMVTFAREIATGSQVYPLGLRPSGEIGVLAEALDEMLLSLELSREKIRDYAENLEQMVHLRTRALRESEEKYRTMVESIPLVVYRLLSNGRTIFVNHSVEDLLGIPVWHVMQDVGFWKNKVLEDDRVRVWPMMDRCLREGVEFKAEYRILHAGGKQVFVLDHAQPILDEQGHVETVDGFLVDVTDRHRLQHQILQTEELRTLTEISARLAHEIRNPLVAAGGFARRLLRGMPEEDPNREKVQIIVQEVARLEKILEKTLAYLKPFEIVAERASLNDLVLEVLAEQRDLFKEHVMTCSVDLASTLPFVPLDRPLFKRVLGSVVQAMVGYCHGQGGLSVQTYSGENAVHAEMEVTSVQISPDDIDHFFYPFTTRLDPTKALDLPLAKMIIHKHRGVIQLRRSEPDKLLMNISIPL